MVEDVYPCRALTWEIIWVLTCSLSSADIGHKPSMKDICSTWNVAESYQVDINLSQLSLHSQVDGAKKMNLSCERNVLKVQCWMTGQRIQCDPERHRTLGVETIILASFAKTLNLNVIFSTWK